MFRRVSLPRISKIKLGFISVALLTSFPFFNLILSSPFYTLSNKAKAIKMNAIKIADSLFACLLLHIHSVATTTISSSTPRSRTRSSLGAGRCYYMIDTQYHTCRFCCSFDNLFFYSQWFINILS
jgi:hypothetical protein